MQAINLKNREPRIIDLAATRLVARSVTMSFAQDKTQELWQGFAPLIKTIQHREDADRYSVQVYPNADFFKDFKPQREFKKYAAVKVSEYDELAADLEKLTIPQGRYAVFDYIGKPSEATETFRYMLKQWLANSNYILANRPHLAVMGPAYKGEQPDSEEELLIPVQLKKINPCSASAQ